MNGKHFLKITKSVDKIKIKGINIFLKLDNGELKILKYNYQCEKSFIDPIIVEEIKKYNNKTPKLYDTCKDKDEFFYFNLNNFSESEDLKISLEKIENGEVILECEKYPEKIEYIIIEILIDNEKIFFIVDYEYNQFFKKKVFGFFIGERFKVAGNSNENIIVNFSPKIIKYKDELIFNTTTPKILNLRNIFKNYIDKNIKLVSSIFDITTETKLSKKILILLGRGILNGELNKFSNLTQENKTLKIDEFKAKYEEKYCAKSNIIYSEIEGINFQSLNAIEKEEIIKLVTNRSAFKILDGALTTSLD